MHRTVKLKTSKVLDKSILVKFYKIMNNHFGDLIEEQDLINDDGQVKKVLIKLFSNKNGTYCYCIQTSRHISSDELRTVTSEFLIEYDAYFEIEGSGLLDVEPERFMSVEEKETLDYDIKKTVHNNWVEYMHSKGWKFSTKFDIQNKCMPMIINYDSLSSAFKSDSQLSNDVVALVNAL